MISITSAQNKLIKEIQSLQAKSKERKRTDTIIIEGIKEIGLAISSGIKIKKILFCPDIISFADIDGIFGDIINGTDVYEVSEAVFSKISYRETTGGVVVTALMPRNKIEDIEITDDCVFIVLESVEKPGNLGAICRVADGAKANGVIICDPHTDIYNPNSIRSSLGCVFTVNVVNSTFDETMGWLKENNIKIFAAELTAAEFYQNIDFNGRAALVFGTEATGLTDKWIENADRRVKIPMRGVIDSLNVTTSVAILTYEAMRQRNFPGLS